MHDLNQQFAHRVDIVAQIELTELFFMLTLVVAGSCKVSTFDKISTIRLVECFSEQVI